MDRRVRFWIWIAWGALAIGPAQGAPVAAGEWRSLRDAGGGAVVEARFEGLKAGHYLLRRRADGRLFEVAPDLLGGEDRAHFGQAAKRLADELSRLNPAAGHDMFSGTPFEARAAEEVAHALGLQPESRSLHSRSWRLYASRVPGYRLFGAMPYSVALYADEQGHATSLSVVYANKGDFGSTAGEAAQHFNGGSEASAATLAAAMEHDAQTVGAALVKVLGEPRAQRFGEGKARHTVRRWDWNGHSLLLSTKEGESVLLQVVPLDLAAAGGRTATTSNTQLHQRLLADVAREPNGDVYLTQIPMVNQGPKGYCVPATFERVLRTMGIESDMYLLAMIGGTRAGGGTSVEALMAAVRSLVYQKGRRTKDIPVKDLRIREVKRYLDAGIPVMWTLFSVDEYNHSADENTATRRKTSDWQAYAASIAAAADKISRKPKPDSKHHICLIVGYNEQTDELAVSDSWGPQFERRWVPAKVAAWASQGGLFLILP